MVKTLNVLQVSGNPLLYPTKDIIISGTKAVCKYLKGEYRKLYGLTDVRVNSAEPNILERRSSVATSKYSDKRSVTETSKKPIKGSNLSISTIPVISVKSLTKVDSNEKKVGGELGTRHSVIRKSRKFIVKSQFSNSNKYVKPFRTRNQDDIDHQALKDLWMQKLKEVLKEQERIIQQER